MATRIRGPRTYSMTRDGDGNRTYKLVTLVESDDLTDGPANVLRTPGLHLPGAVWSIDGDVDLWAFCKLDATVTPHQQTKEGSKVRVWLVEQTFSSKSDGKKCRDQQIDNPLLEPPRVNGGYTKYQEEATHDRFGQPIVSSSWEPIRGPQVEFDANRSTFTIEQNVSTALQGYLLPEQMIDCVNDRPIWGRPARCVKLSAAPWELKYFGQCMAYYTRKLEFETFVRAISDELTATSAAILSGGLSYAVGEVLQLAAGGVDVGVTVLVLSVSGTGAIESAVVIASSTQATAPANPATVQSTSGSGTGATFSLVWQAKLASGFDRDLLDEGTKALRGHLDSVTGTYVHEQIGGQDPDPMNPMHFKRFVGWDGNPCRVILNGSGDPAGVVVGIDKPTNALFLSIASANMGNDLDDETKWIRITSNVDSIDIWDAETSRQGLYVAGNLIKRNIGSASSPVYELFIATDDPFGNEVPGELGPGTWLLIPDPFGRGLTNAGDYDATATYDTAQYVRDANDKTTAGRIHVEKYKEANFALLGVPLTF